MGKPTVRFNYKAANRFLSYVRADHAKVFIVRTDGESGRYPEVFLNGLFFSCFVAIRLESVTRFFIRCRFVAYMLVFSVQSWISFRISAYAFVLSSRSRAPWYGDFFTSKFDFCTTE